MTCGQRGRIGVNMAFIVAARSENRACRCASDPLHFYNTRDKMACGMPVPPAIDLPQGTLHLLILRAIALEPMHGWAISQRIQQVTHDVVQIPQGSLYPALHRLERRGWIAASWSTSTNNRRAKYYRLTADGKRNLEREASDWQILAEAVARVLKTC